MSSTDPDHAADLARNLADLLSAYEEELMALELTAPGIAPLRRAIGTAIAEAHYWIADQAAPADGWVSPGDGRTRQANS
jgi:hypothetical protein